MTTFSKQLKLWILVLGVFYQGVLKMAADNFFIPQDAQELLTSPWRSIAKFQGTQYGSYRWKTEANVDILEATLTMTPQSQWSYQVLLPLSTEIKKGHIYLLTVEMRMISSSDESSLGRINLVIEHAQPPDYPKILSRHLYVGNQWQIFWFPFQAWRDIPLNEGQIGFQMGFKPQTIQLRNPQLYYFPERKDTTGLPRTRLTYLGREKDAGWRTEARKRIEQYRKADLHLTILDAQGNPVPDCKIEIKMARHGFPFGTAVNVPFFMRDPSHEDNKKYRETIQQLFTFVVAENSMKWPQFENPQEREMVVKWIEWLEKNRIRLRGHCLVWPGWRWLPGGENTSLGKVPHGLRANYLSIREKEGEERAKEWLRQRVLNHIQEEVTFFRGKVTDWDVLNEPYTNRDLQKILGDEAMVEWFRTAKEADPNCKMFINDFGILPNDKAHQQHYEDTIRWLLQQGAPIEGIGMQGHMGSSLTPPPVLIEILDRFAKFNLPIYITELDFKMDPEERELQGEYVYDFMLAVFSHPRVEAILMWGFWDGSHWLGDAPLFYKDWSLKPSGKAWMDLVFKEWWTQETKQTDQKGQVSVRGFLGEYDIHIYPPHTSQPYIHKLILPSQGQSSVIRLP